MGTLALCWLTAFLSTIIASSLLAQERARVVVQMPHVAMSDEGWMYVSANTSGELLLTSQGSDQKLWDVRSGRLLRTVPYAGQLEQGVLSPNGILALGVDNQDPKPQLKLWNTETGRVLRSHEHFGGTLRFASTGKQIIAEFPDGFHLLSVPDLAPVKVVLLSKGSKLLSVSTDASHYVELEGGSIWVRQTLRQKKILEVKLERRPLLGANLSRDGLYLGAVFNDGSAKIWSATTQKEVASTKITSNDFKPENNDRPPYVYVDDEGKTLFWAGGNKVYRWSVANNNINVVSVGDDFVHSFAPLKANASVVSGGTAGMAAVIDNWDETVARRFDSRNIVRTPILVSSDGAFVFLARRSIIEKVDASSMRVVQSYRDNERNFQAIAIDKSSRRLAAADREGKQILIWDIESGHILSRLSLQDLYPQCSLLVPVDLVFAPESNHLAVSVRVGDEIAGINCTHDQELDKSFESTNLSASHFWDLDTGKVVLKLPGVPVDFKFTGSGAKLIYEDSEKVYEVDLKSLSRRMLSRVDADSKFQEVSDDGRTLFYISKNSIVEVGLNGGRSTRKNFSAPRSFGGGLVAGYDKRKKEYSVLSYKSNNVLSRFKLPVEDENTVISPIPNGLGFIFSGDDGRHWLWRRDRGLLPVTMFAPEYGSFAAYTQEGFFIASATEDIPIHAVKGTRVTTIDQLYRSLFNPDLVREAIEGDTRGELAEAAKALDLDVVLGSGPAPDVEIEMTGQVTTTTRDVIDVTARLTDKGKGVGRVEWRVNGITAAVIEKPIGKALEHILTRSLALDAGENVIEVVGYNDSNLLASRPARATVTYAGQADLTKPRLHVLAIGINKYTDDGVPGHPGFKPLNLAVKDAQAIAAELQRAATSDIYAGRPNIVVLTDGEATRSGIATAIDRMAGDIHPRDTFIFFAAGHGYSDLGRFFLLPQDYNGGAHPRMLERNGIGQDQLQDWLANRIKAKRALILLDTCESGALVAGHLVARISSAAASEAGIGRLHEATGRPVLTAAAKGQPAWEGLIREGSSDRHGVFTWALLDALQKGDTNRNGRIELSELVAHVQNAVPEIAKRFGGEATGRGAGATLVQTITTPATPLGTRKSNQAARFGSRGEDFAIAGTVR